MNFQEWQTKTRRADAIAERTSKMIIERARKACIAAGLSGDLLGIHPHNAMCSFNVGKPWPNIDYSLVRKSLYLQKKSFEPGDIARKLSKRIWSEIK